MIRGLDKIGVKVSGWAQAGNLVTGDTGGSVSLQAQFGEASVFTAMISIDPPPGGARPVVKVIFTTNGIPSVRQLDCARAASIGGIAESVRIIVNDATVHPSLLGVQYGVTLSIGEFPRNPSAIGPILSALNAALVTSTSSVVVNIPAGASGFYVYDCPGTGGSAKLDIKQITSGISGTLVLFCAEQTEGAPEMPYPLVAGAVQLSITNSDAQSALVTVIFTMDG